MAKNYETESKTNKNSTTTDCRDAYGNEMKSKNKNKITSEITSKNEAGSENAGRNARNKSQNKTSQSYTSEGNTSSRY